MARLNFPDPSTTQEYEEAGITWTWNSDLEVWSTEGQAKATDMDYSYPESGVTRQIEDRLSDYASVKDFGAKGDGVADDTAAFKAAFNKNVPIYIPPGTYLLSDTIPLAHPFMVRGAGMDLTRLIWSNLGGYNGKNGIEVYCVEDRKDGTDGYGKGDLASTGYRQGTGVISDLSLITNGDGNTAFMTPKSEAPETIGNQDVRSVIDYFQPRYVVERIQVRGATPEGGSTYIKDNHFSDSWYCGINIGCSREPVVRDCYLMGPFREDDVTNSDTKDTCTSRAIEIGGAAVGNEWSPSFDADGSGAPIVKDPPNAMVKAACISALIDHNFVYYYGRGLHLGHRLSQGVARACHINTCWAGIYGPDPIDYWNSMKNEWDTYFTWTEFLVHDMQLQCQRYGVKANSGWINCTNVRSSRSDGADIPAYPWYGFHYEKAGNVVISGCRAYGNAPGSKENFGMYFKSGQYNGGPPYPPGYGAGDYVQISDCYILASNQSGLDRGIILDGVGRVQTSNICFLNNKVAFELKGGAFCQSTNTLLQTVDQTFLINDDISKQLSDFGNLATGKYSYQILDSFNLSSNEVLSDGIYSRNSDYVDVTLRVRGTPSAAGTCTLDLSLPPAEPPQPFAYTRNAMGTATGVGNGVSVAGSISAIPNTNRVRLTWNAANTVLTDFDVKFTYYLIRE